MSYDGEYQGYSVRELLDMLADCQGVDRADNRIEFCGWGDYVGSVLDRANYESLLETFGNDGFYINAGYHEYHALQLVTDQREPMFPDLYGGIEEDETIRERLVSLVQIFSRLESDYPLISDEKHSEVLDTLAEEYWDDCLWREIPDDLHDMFPDDIQPGEEWAQLRRLRNAYPPGLRGHDDVFRDSYFGYEGNEWVAETATNVVNKKHHEAVAHAAYRVFNLGHCDCYVCQEGTS
jgi:hypothetical protein